MGAFNTLIVDLECPNCNRVYEEKIQFKFGDTWQYEYKLGDTIKWGGNDQGWPNLPSVKVYGIAELGACPICGYLTCDDYDIYIKYDKIIKFTGMADISAYETFNYSNAD